ncbi:C-8 sterol isomerase [Ustilago trichophora]|uniref:C-8 sterol isomerase n=1 Tax=Ustilago trichophora TaxID=86804 RepID=A0A5C3E1L8_9BASI|nr:C-8 sterol isomerase [Ustilago trichophora]
MSSHRPRSTKGANGASPAPKRSWVLISALIVGFCALVAALDSIRSNFYIFDHNKIYKIASTAVANHPGNATAIFDDILDNLRADPKTAPYINKNHFSVETEWMFNNAGGAMGSMYIIHASITEYLIFFGTPVGTEGHTGRHTADDYFNILTGNQYAFPAGALKAEHYPAGSVHHLRRGTVKQYMMPEDGCWALELAQGWIPPMLPFGLADVLSSTLDLPTFGITVWITAREMIGNLLIGKF